MLAVQRPELDAIYQQTAGRQARTVCITAANAGEGVSVLALALARRGAAAGRKVLLIDANLEQPSTSAGLGMAPTRWSPLDGSARGAVARPDGLDLAILPAPVGVDPMAFRDPRKWRRMFDVDLAGYDLIVIDTPPVDSADHDAIPAEAVAAASAVTVLVVLTGVTTEPSVRAAAERLTTAGASLCGAVFNDRLNPSLADELARRVDRLARFAPRLSRYLRRWIRTSSILNLQP